MMNAEQGIANAEVGDQERMMNAEQGMMNLEVEIKNE